MPNTLDAFAFKLKGSSWMIRRGGSEKWYNNTHENKIIYKRKRKARKKIKEKVKKNKRGRTKKKDLFCTKK